MIENMVCQVYGCLKKPNVNNVRYEKWCGEKVPEPSENPPTKGELYFKGRNFRGQKLSRVKKNAKFME